MPVSPSVETGLARLATEMVAATQVAGVRLLEAEMKSLVQLLPGAGPAALLPTADEVEAGFDNLPV